MSVYCTISGPHDHLLDEGTCIPLNPEEHDMDNRPIKPMEAYAMGKLHAALMEAGCSLEYPVGLTGRYVDVTGLAPQSDGAFPVMRLIIEEVQ